MAILDTLSGVEVAITVDGKDLHEYEDLAIKDDRGTVTRYVEAITGAKFAFRLKTPKGFEYRGDRLVFACYVDGTMVGEWIVRDWQTMTKAFEMVKNSRYGPSREFKFNELAKHDGPASAADINRARDLGCLKVTVSHHIRSGTPYERMIYPKPHQPVSTSSTESISEKATKGEAISHSAGYDMGEATSNEPQLCTYHPSDYVDGDKTPTGTFIFNYRSKVALKHLLIIPRSPSPVPLRDRPIDQLSHDERAELIQQLLTETAETTRVKREIKGESQDDNTRARKRICTSVRLELNDDGTFSEVAGPADKAEQKEKNNDVVVLLD